MFSAPGSEALGSRYTAVRLLGGDDMTEEGRAFAKHYRVGSFPTLLAMSPDGGVLAAGLPRDLAGLLAQMAEAATAEATFRATVTKLGTSTQPEDVRTLAGLYAARWQWAEARKRYETLLAAEPTLDDTRALLRTVEELGDVAARRALLARLIRDYAQDPDRIHWRIALAELGADEATIAGWRASLRELLASVTTNGDRAAVRQRLASYAKRARDMEKAHEHWDWILTHAPKSRMAVSALHEKAIATVHAGYGRGDLAEVRRGRALLQRLVDEHGEDDHARAARSLLVQVDMIIKQLEARPKGPGK